MGDISSLLIMEKDEFFAHLSTSEIIRFHTKYIPFLKESTRYAHKILRVTSMIQIPERSVILMDRLRIFSPA